MMGGLIPLIIFFVAFLLRYSLIELSEVGSDETIYIHAGIEYIKNLYHLETRWDYWTFNCEHPPLAKYIIGIILLPFDIPGEKIGWPAHWMRVFPVRLTWALIGSLTVVVLYFYGKEYKGSGFGLLASTIMLFNPLWLFYTINAYNLHPPMVLFATLAQLLLYRGIAQKRYSHLICSAVLFGLSLSTTYLALPIILGSFVWTSFLKIRDAHKWKMSWRSFVQDLSLHGLFLVLTSLTFILLWGLWLIPNGVIKCLVYSVEKAHKGRLPLIFEHKIHATWNPIRFIFLDTSFPTGWKAFWKLGIPLLNFKFYPWESLSIGVGLMMLMKRICTRELTDFESLIFISFFTGVVGLSNISGFFPQWLLFLTPYTSILCSIGLYEMYDRSKHMLASLFKHPV